MNNGMPTDGMKKPHDRILPCGLTVLSGEALPPAALFRHADIGSLFALRPRHDIKRDALVLLQRFEA